MDTKTIEKLPVGKILWDKGSKNSVNGLHVRSYPSGRKTFSLRYKDRNGIIRRPTLGPVSIFTIGQARSYAKEILRLAVIGEFLKNDFLKYAKQQDVMPHKVQYTPPVLKDITVKQLYDKTLKEHWDTPRFRASGHYKQVIKMWKVYLAPTFEKIFLMDVKTEMVRRWLKKLESTPTSANRALEILSKIFNYAEEMELKPQGTNPCKLVKAFPSRKRNRYATPEEIKRIGRLLAEKFNENPEAVAFLYTLLNTGSRPRAIERSTWEQLKVFEKDGEQYGQLNFYGKTTAKTGENETVIIPPEVLKMLYSLPKNKTLTNCSASRGSKYWREIRKEIGCQDLSMRDFRRTFATVGMSSGIGMGQISEVLNHKSVQTTKIYSKLTDQTRVETVAAIAQTISNIIKD